MSLIFSTKHDPKTTDYYPYIDVTDFELYSRGATQTVTIDDGSTLEKTDIEFIITTYMIPLFQDQLETQFVTISKTYIDEWFQVNATRKSWWGLANTTLIWACEKDSIKLSDSEGISVLLNGTFIDPNSKYQTK